MIFKRRKYHPPNCDLSSPIILRARQQYLYVTASGGVLNFELGTDVQPEVSTTTL